MDSKIKREKRIRRHRKIRAEIKGTNERPRLCVFRSLKHIYGQLIDDEKGKTLVMASDQEIKKSKKSQPTADQPQPTAGQPEVEKAGKVKDEKKKVIRVRKVYVAYEVGKLLAEKALKKKIQKVVFDRGGYKYHGRVKAVAEGARENGLKF